MISTKYNEEFVQKIIQQKEGNQLDFKQKITSQEKIAKTISAFSNSTGGIIVIGISDQKKLIGIDPDEEQYMVDSANERYCVPRASLKSFPIKLKNEKYPEFSDEEDISVLVVEVRQSLGPKIQVKSKSGEFKTFQRVGDQSLLISNLD